MSRITFGLQLKNKQTHKWGLPRPGGPLGGNFANNTRQLQLHLKRPKKSTSKYSGDDERLLSHLGFFTTSVSITLVATCVCFCQLFSTDVSHKECSLFFFALLAI
jgi:hypothetical protein